MIKEYEIAPVEIIPPFTESEVQGFVPSTQKFRGDQLYYSPTAALTAATATVINTGDAASDTAITNMRTRINELEARLKTLGLLKTA